MPQAIPDLQDAKVPAPEESTSHQPEYRFWLSLVLKLPTQSRQCSMPALWPFGWSLRGLVMFPAREGGPQMALTPRQLYEQRVVGSQPRYNGVC